MHILSATCGLSETLSKWQSTVEGVKLQTSALVDLSRPVVPSVNQLRHLSLHLIPFTTFPTWISSAQNLQYLSINAASLKTLPEITGLPELEFFLFTGSISLTTVAGRILPDSLKLRYLSLSCNSISSLQPNALEHLQQLEMLILSGNSITTIDPRLTGSLSNLKALDIRNAKWATNKITSILETIKRSSIVCLRTVATASKGITTLTSEHFRNISMLTHLELANNNAMIWDPAILTNTSSTLTYLDFQNMKLTSLAPFEYLLRSCSLETFYLGENDFSDSSWINESWGLNLRALKAFSVASANITSLTAPLYLLLRNSDLSNYVFDSLQMSSNPLSTDPCTVAIWSSMQSGSPMGLVTTSADCRKTYTDFLAAATDLIKRKKDPTQLLFCPPKTAAATILSYNIHYTFLAFFYCFLWYCSIL